MENNESQISELTGSCTNDFRACLMIYETGPDFFDVMSRHPVK